MHKCNLFKLALHVEPLDCWVEAQLQAVSTLSLDHNKARVHTEKSPLKKKYSQKDCATKRISFNDNAEEPPQSTPSTAGRLY